MGKRNPVRLVSAVVKRKSAVVTGKLFEASIPPTTISPLPIATRVIATCKIVKAPTDIPRIMEVPAEHDFDPDYSRELRPAKWGCGSGCAATIGQLECPRRVKRRRWRSARRGPLYPQKRTSELSLVMSALCQKQTFTAPHVARANAVTSCSRDCLTSGW